MQNNTSILTTWNKTNDLVSVETYVKFYNCSKDLVYAAKRLNNPYVIKYNNKLYIDLKELKRRREFHNKVHEDSIEMYWVLIEELGTNNLVKELSKTIGKTQQHWRTFLNKDLFSIAFRKRNLLSYKIPITLWKFYRWGRIYKLKIKDKKCVIKKKNYLKR